MVFKRGRKPSFFVYALSLVTWRLDGVVLGTEGDILAYPERGGNLENKRCIEALFSKSSKSSKSTISTLLALFCLSFVDFHLDRKSVERLSLPYSLKTIHSRRIKRLLNRLLNRHLL